MKNFYFNGENKMKMQEIKGGVGKSEGSWEGIGCWGEDSVAVTCYL